MKDIFLYIGIIILGLIVGSFLNVIIYRLPRKISILRLRSFCPYCNKNISFFDNIPVLSFFILRGRCRNCKSKIPIRYPLVEVFTAILFLTNYIFFRLSLQTLMGIILCCLLIVITFIDIDFRIIPNVIVLPFSVLGLIINSVIGRGEWWLPFVYSFGAFLFMFIIHLIYPKGMGMGDVKLSLMIGAYLLRSVIVALFLSFVFGSVYGLFLIILKKKKLKQSIPLGPFISMGSIIGLFWGDYIIRWYISFF